VYTWNIEEGIAFCIAFLARAAAKESARAGASALAGAAHGAHRLPEASLSVAQRGLGGAAHGLQAASSFSIGRDEGSFHVPCLNNSMRAKKMRDFHMGGYFIQSDDNMRYRTSDGKCHIGDSLKGSGRYKRADTAQDAVVKMMQNNDEMVKDLKSFEVDKTLLDMVSTYFLIKKI
jgi:hypothetical protein